MAYVGVCNHISFTEINAYLAAAEGVIYNAEEILAGRSSDFEGIDDKGIKISIDLTELRAKLKDIQKKIHRLDEEEKALRLAEYKSKLNKS